MAAQIPARASTETGNETRERILEAALGAFAEHGFDGATTREIAERAGVNLGLIQYYFDGKQNLWRASVDRAFAQLRSELEVAPPAEDALDAEAQTRSLIHRFVGFVARHTEFIRLMHDEGKRKGPRMRWIVDHHVKPLYAAIRALLEHARERGMLPGDFDPVHYHYIVVGAVSLIFHQAEECKRLTGVDPFDPEVVKNHAHAVERVLLGPDPKEDSR